MEPPKHILDYSSPAEEQKRDRAIAEESRNKLETYNESTFGERRPIASEFLRQGVFIVTVSLIVGFLPRGCGYPIAWVTLAGYLLWRLRKDGWSAIGRPFRWW